MRIYSLFSLLALPLALHGHFTYVIPHPGGQSADLIIGEKLYPDSAVDPAIAGKAKLRVRDANGRDTDLALTLSNDRFEMKLPGSGQRVIHGFANMGISPNVRAPKPFLLLYYPKAIVGSPFSGKTTIGGDQVVELVPQGAPGKASLLMLVRGVPQPNAEITVVLPNDSQVKLTTNAQGVAGPLPFLGRYAAWARYWEDGKGESEGKPYEQLRHYAMLVFDALPAAVSAATLPEAASSFGAAVHEDNLYVYGGHVANTHNYSTASVSGRFHRWNAAKSAWEKLPDSKPLQGMNLVTHGGMIYRVGGMEPRNAPGAQTDNHSVADTARFNPATKAWEQMPALPEPRSSHDAVAAGDLLVVTGGWTLAGSSPTTWSKTTLVMDLKAASPAWKPIPQPFERRALIAAVHNGKVYVMGGIMPSGSVSTDVDIFDPKTGSWSKGPALPGPAINGFAPAAAVHEGQLYVSVGDGGVYRLHPNGSRWDDAGANTARLAHRMVSLNGSLLILGGAAKGKNFDLVEALPVTR
jgi:N-acetylneuraminic acid mutarotase